MKMVIQRVKEASVTVESQTVGKIGKGLLIFLGVEQGDSEKEVQWHVNKALNLRIFPNQEGKFDHSLIDVEGELLVVSQFTLLGNCEKGRRPDFLKAAPPKEALKLYKRFIQECQAKKVKVQEGVFQAHMEVSLTNDGPVTLIL